VAPNGTASPEEARAALLQFLAQMAAELSSGTCDLPCFPDVVLRIRTALDDPKNTPGKTVTVVGAEPRLAARLLQTANSAAFNPANKPVTDLRTAITGWDSRWCKARPWAFAVQTHEGPSPLRSIAQPWVRCGRKASRSL